MRPWWPKLFAVVWLTACSPGRCEECLPGVVFVSDEIFGARHEAQGMPRHGTSHWREGYMYHRATTQHPLERTTTPTRPGRNLYTLIPAGPGGTLSRITQLTEGEVFDPEPSYDGRKILFSMRRDGEDWFNLYEIQADGRGLVQLTDGPFNDVSGVYLPDGRIVFVSDRAGYLEEYHEERTETLWIANGDGTGIEQLTFNPGTVFDPTVLADGRILFSLWDTFLLNIPPADKHETYLMTIRPDGTEESHYFGAGEHEFFSRERHSGVGLTQAGQLPDGTLLLLSELGPSLLRGGAGRHAGDALSPVFPGATTIQLGGATHRVHLSPIGSRTTPYPLPDGTFLFAATRPGERDLGLYRVDPRTRRTWLVFNDPERAEFDPRPLLLARPRPRELPPKASFDHSPSRYPPAAATRDPRLEVTGRARFVVTDAWRSDRPEHAAVLPRARYFRVIEALHTAVTSSSHTSLATQVLGEVPILPDGSAYFEAPADTPLFLQPVDAAGRPLEFAWRQPETSVPVGSRQRVLEMTYVTARPGEVKSCNGCHAPRQEATDSHSTVAALGHPPVTVDRDLTDLLYRRNEPEEYRLSVRFGEADRYRPWLDSPDADLRRRACEALALLEDEARPDAAAIAIRLDDDDPAVRRSAARALARLGSLADLPRLVRALDDADWQVRLAAAAACEAITGGVADHELLGDPARIELAVGRGPDGLAELQSGALVDRRRAWFEAASRLGESAPEPARQAVRDALDVPLPPPVLFEPWPGKRQPLDGTPPESGAIRAAGWLRDAPCVPKLIPWLARHEYPDHAADVALALGRIGTSEAVAALWDALRRDVPERKPYLNRYVQHGPRPEEYALLRGLILAQAVTSLDDVPLVIGLLPGTFLEKPRFEDRLRPESQRVRLGRLLLERAQLRERAVAILVDVLRGKPPADSDALAAQILRGINLERPYAEHQRPFPVVPRIEPEQALWLLGCLAVDRREVPEEFVAPYLTRANWRERIDAAVLLNVLGCGDTARKTLFAEADKPYSFGEIMGIGKSHFDPNFRDKCYLVMALAHHVDDVERLRPLADPQRRYRDVRYGLAVGLGQRGAADGIDLLSEIATQDPIGVIRRQACQSLRAIQETQRLAGLTVPEIRLPAPRPFEAWYPPRGLAWPGPIREPLPPGCTGAPVACDWASLAPATILLDATTGEELQRRIAAGLQADNYRDLNNANNQAPGATRMMVRGMHSFADAVATLAAADPAACRPVLQQLLASPYPFANFLALREVSGGSLSCTDAGLTDVLRTCSQSSDTVKFSWACEALAAQRVTAAIPVLAQLARAENPPGLHGPAGMGHGWPAARALGRLAADLQHPEVRPLLASPNAWVRAGVLCGLTESRAPGIEGLLKQLLTGSQPALIADQARVGLAQLGVAH